MSIADTASGGRQMPLWTDERADGSGAAEVRVRHSRRARRVAVRIHAGGRVELVIPRGVSERQARAFLDSRADWVRHHVARRRSEQPIEAEFPPRRVELSGLGESWRVFRAGGEGRPRVVAGAGLLEFRGTGSPAEWRHALRRWLARHALSAFQVRLAELADRHGFSYAAVRVRRQRTRWGSCSTRGVISLNLALLFQSPDVLRYLLCHELAHTRHMNHSDRFWACVAQCEPRYRELDAALGGGWRRVPAWLMEHT